MNPITAILYAQDATPIPVDPEIIDRLVQAIIAILVQILAGLV